MRKYLNLKNSDLLAPIVSRQNKEFKRVIQRLIDKTGFRNTQTSPGGKIIFGSQSPYGFIDVCILRTEIHDGGRNQIREVEIALQPVKETFRIEFREKVLPVTVDEKSIEWAGITVFDDEEDLFTDEPYNAHPPMDHAYRIADYLRCKEHEQLFGEWTIVVNEPILETM